MQNTDTTTFGGITKTEPAAVCAISFFEGKPATEFSSEIEPIVFVGDEKGYIAAYGLGEVFDKVKESMNFKSIGNGFGTSGQQQIFEVI